MNERWWMDGWMDGWNVWFDWDRGWDRTCWDTPNYSPTSRQLHVTLSPCMYLIPSPPILLHTRVLSLPHHQFSYHNLNPQGLQTYLTPILTFTPSNPKHTNIITKIILDKLYNGRSWKYYKKSYERITWPKTDQSHVLNTDGPPWHLLLLLF